MIKIISRLFKKKPDKTYSVEAVYHVDTSEVDAAIEKAAELEGAIKRARTLAVELARMTKSLKASLKVDFIPAEPADITADYDGNP